MFKTSRALLVGIGVLVAGSGVTARAQDPYGLGFGYLFGYGAVNTPRITSFIPAPPYFALHPPVYYGQRYMRPYGDSPFASWPQLQPSPAYSVYPAAPHAQVLVNPYAPEFCPGCPAEGPVDAPAAPPAAPAAESPVVGARPATGPLVIDNPYYPGSQASSLVAASQAE